jgi:hypothetical protein
MNDNLLQFFWKNSSRTSSSFNSISSSFLVHFELFKSRWVCQLGLYKTSLYSKAKDATIKDLKLIILICFHSLVIEHWTPLHQTPHILHIPLPNWDVFLVLETLGGRLNVFIELQNWSNNVWGFNLIWLFKCSFTYLNWYIIFFKNIFNRWGLNFFFSNKWNRKWIYENLKIHMDVFWYCKIEWMNENILMFLLHIN